MYVYIYICIYIWLMKLTNHLQTTVGRTCISFVLFLRFKPAGTACFCSAFFSWKVGWNGWHKPVCDIENGHRKSGFIR